MAKVNNPVPNEEYSDVDDTMEELLYARHAEIKTLEDLKEQRGTSIPALFNLLYKFVQNPSTISVETFKRMVDTDDTIGSGMDFLCTSLAARIGRYNHPNKEITEMVNKALDGIDGGFTNTIKEIMSAAWAGFAVGEVVWANKEEGFVPQKVVVLPPTTVLFETERTGELTKDGIMQYQRNYNPYIQGNGYMGGGGSGFGFAGASGGRPDPFAKFGDFPFPMRTANSFNWLAIRIPTQKCIHYSFDAQGKFGNPYGRSLLRRAYKYYVTKDAILQMMMIALDRKGTALTIVYADPNAMMEEDTGGTAQSLRNNANGGIRADTAAHKAFKNIHNDSVIVLPGKKGEIFETDFMPSSPNTGEFIQALDFCNKSIMRALLVPGLIFGTGDGSGSWSLGQEHAKTFDKLCDSLNSGLEHIFIQQLIRPILAYNFPEATWKKDGVGGFSKKTLSRDEIEKEMEVYEKGINTGIIDRDDLNDLNKMRETIGFEPRTEIIEREDPFEVQADAQDASPEGEDEVEGSKPKEEAKEEPKAKEKELTRLRRAMNYVLRLFKRG